jgi:TIR domain
VSDAQENRALVFTPVLTTERNEVMACAISVVEIGGGGVFMCYAHADNSSNDPKSRWLDRLLEFLRPLIRQNELSLWSDKEIEAGTHWHRVIQSKLLLAKVGVLLVSPAFLASDYIARSEVPVLLKNCADKGLRIIPVIISPCLYEETRFKYPDWKTGPDELTLGSIQSINPPSKTLVEMTEGEQNRVLLNVARQISSWLEECKKQAAAEETSKVLGRPVEVESEQERVARIVKQIEQQSPSETSKHVFDERGVCLRCSRSAEAISHFRWFHCD